MSKTKSGYFFLSFALLMVAVLTPVILVTSMNDLSVKTSINLYQNKLQSRNFGMSELDAKFEEFLGLNTDPLDKFDSNLDVPLGGENGEDDNNQLLYRFNSRSTLIPSNLIGALTRFASTNRTTRGLFDVNKILFRPTTDDPNTGVFVDTSRDFNLEAERILDNENNRVNLDVGDDNLRLPEFYYNILPAAGTGDASSFDCRDFDLNLDLFSREPEFIPPQMDPMDNPCNFNKWSVGESILIPLYHDGQKVIVNGDAKMALRLRLPCVDNKPFCNETERHNLSSDESLIQVALVDMESDKVWVAANRIEFSKLINFRTLALTELGIVVNGSENISGILSENNLEKPALVLKLVDDRRQLTRDGRDMGPFSELSYQVVSSVPFADNKLVMTASVFSNSRLYDLGSRVFEPEVNIDLGVVFGN